MGFSAFSDPEQQTLRDSVARLSYQLLTAVAGTLLEAQRTGAIWAKCTASELKALGGNRLDENRRTGDLMEQYKVGTLVENTGAPQWGPGKIVRIENDRLYIVFRDIEGSVAKKLVASAVGLRRAASQSDPILDNLPPAVEKKGGWVIPGKSLTLESIKRRFLHEFPAGFADPKYAADERDYKLTAHQAFENLLGLDQIRALLSRGDVKSLAAQALSVLSTVNLLAAPFESGAFRDAMQDENAAKRYFKALVTLLETTPVNEQVFTAYSAAVCSLPARRGRVATWPVATVLPYLARPDIHMFLKPEVTNHAAESLGFDLQYKSTPNWRTYERLLRMGTTYLDLLRPMGAVDFVDVQSFFFVSCGGYDSEKPAPKRLPEVVLKAYAEGGEIRLLREKNAGDEYQFWIECNESALADFLHPDDLPDAGGLCSRSRGVASIDEAFRMMDRYAWWHLYPAEVHPDFAVDVLREVNRKGGSDAEERWLTRLRR